jgi:predicted nuclease of predicted toxin-antitoxin system
VTFFFDHHHSHKIVRALRELGVDAIHLRDVFEERGVDDVIWIARAAEEGWVVITADLHIRTRKAEKTVFQKAGLITFFVNQEYNSKDLRSSGGSLISGGRSKQPPPPLNPETASESP